MPVWRKEHEPARVTVHFVGMVITAISGTSICGQISGRANFATWGAQGAMSLPTAVCLVLAGIGFFLLSRGEDRRAGLSL